MGVLGRYDDVKDDIVRPGTTAWRYDETESSSSGSDESDDSSKCDSSQYLGMKENGLDVCFFFSLLTSCCDAIPGHPLQIWNHLLGPKQGKWL